MNDALTFGLGALLGAALAAFIYERSFSLAARYHRTGNTDAPLATGPTPHTTAPSPEAAAMRQVLQDSVERGADQLQEIAAQSGTPLSRAQALDDAREMIEQSGQGTLGGAR